MIIFRFDQTGEEFILWCTKKTGWYQSVSTKTLSVTLALLFYPSIVFGIEYSGWRPIVYGGVIVGVLLLIEARWRGRKWLC